MSTALLFLALENPAFALDYPACGFTDDPMLNLRQVGGLAILLVLGALGLRRGQGLPR